MNTKSLNIAFGFVLAALFSSCVGYRDFSIEVFKPAQLSLPSSTKNIALVSRNLKYPKDTLQKYQSRNHQLIRDKSRVNTDSIAIKTYLDSIAQRLKAHNPSYNVIVLPVNTLPKNRVIEIVPAKTEWYRALTEKTGADVLILADMYSSFYSYNSYNQSPEAKVVTSNIWSIYQSESQKIIGRFSQVDTLFWDGNDENGRYVKAKIPGKTDAIALAAGVNGVSCAKQILPSWAKVGRNFMIVNNKDMKKAVQSAQKNQWDTASEIWQSCSVCPNKQLKVAALYNLALASEMNGDINRAIGFTDEAAKASTGLFLSSENEAVRKYSAILHQRRNELTKLSEQLENQ